MLYERLSELIEKTGKSMNQIEHELNYPRNTIQSYKRSNPSAKRLAELAKYFDVSTDYLLGITSDPKYPLTQSEVEERFSASATPISYTDENLNKLSLDQLIEKLIPEKRNILFQNLPIKITQDKLIVKAKKLLKEQGEEQAKRDLIQTVTINSKLFDERTIEKEDPKFDELLTNFDDLDKDKKKEALLRMQILLDEDNSNNNSLN